MTREKQLKLLFPHLVGKRIRIFTQIPNSHWAIANLVDFKSNTLFLKDVEIYGGLKQDTRMISTNSISKIELVQ